MEEIIAFPGRRRDPFEIGKQFSASFLSLWNIPLNFGRNERGQIFGQAELEVERETNAFWLLRAGESYNGNWRVLKRMLTRILMGNICWIFGMCRKLVIFYTPKGGVHFFPSLSILFF